MEWKQAAGTRSNLVSSLVTDHDRIEIEAVHGYQTCTASYCTWAMRSSQGPQGQYEQVRSADAIKSTRTASGGEAVYKSILGGFPGHLPGDLPRSGRGREHGNADLGRTKRPTHGGPSLRFALARVNHPRSRSMPTHPRAACCSRRASRSVRDGCSVRPADGLHRWGSHITPPSVTEDGRRIPLETNAPPRQSSDQDALNAAVGDSFGGSP